MLLVFRAAVSRPEARKIVPALPAVPSNTTHAPRGGRTYARKTLLCAGGLRQERRQGHAADRHDPPGCRIGVAVSGGVDSFVLLKTLHIRQGIVPFRFEIMAIHLNPGFDPQSHMPLAAWLSRHGIPSHLEVTDFGPHAHSAGNQRRSPCFRCAWLRRKRLFELCSQYKLTHLALGHNAEDHGLHLFS